MLENMKIKNTTICECEREFVITDIQKLERVDDKNFYSGVVKHYSKAICPKCGKEVILLLKQVGQTYKVINIAEYGHVTAGLLTTTENNEETLHKTELNLAQNKTASITTNLENNEVNTESNELICPVCKKECKNKSGLTAHIRTHENN